MFITDFYMALIIGVASTLLFTEKTGITPGGLIAASYLVFDSPISLALVFLVSFLTYWIVNFVLPNFVILYGKRKFTATLIVAVDLKLVFEFAYPLTPFPTFEFRGIGVIVPALLANTYSRQGIKLTVISTLLMTGFVFVLMQLLYLV